MCAHRLRKRRRPHSGVLRLGHVSSLILMVAVWMVTSSVANVHALSPVLREYQVKAAFLYNFAKFVEWPAQTLADTSVPISVCVLGEDPFGGALESIEGKTVKGGKLAIRRPGSAQDLGFCHILFIGSSERERLASILETLKDRSVLTVSDVEQFAQSGGMINLTTRKNKVRLEINLDAAEQAGLKISSKLLKLATVVQNGR